MTPAPRWPVVLFDFDGTLGDTIPLIINSFHHTLHEVLGISSPEAEIRSWIGRSLRAVFAERYPERADELITTYRHWNLANHDDQIRQVDGMADLLTDLDAAGVRAGVVSSKGEDTVHLGLRALGLEGALPVLAALEHTARHKPDPAPLAYAVDRLGVDPADCVYVGDAVVDLQAAAAAGMDGIGVTWGAGESAALRAEPHVEVVADTRALRAVLLPGRADRVDPPKTPPG
ncbi:HAD family hydrolase [Ornithinicoccus hortensis]|uniref:HAD family hydrolase n=1 Tax=Ornithinicoccus hortensis TaxID=82346 RepID=UPI001152EAE2|nr:HAD-IA family hydrolase [Ornithinicoccus hortensis]